MYSRRARFSSIRWRVTAPYIFIILLTTFALALYISTEARRARLDDLRAHLIDEAWLLADSLVAPLLAGVEVRSDAVSSMPSDLNELANRWSDILDQRVTVIDAGGVVLGDSHADYVQMENHLNRPEIEEARRTGTGTATRFSQTLRQDVMYAAAAVKKPDSVVGSQDILGYARVALSLDDVRASVNQLGQTILVSGAVLAFFAAFLAIYISSRTIGPVQQLTTAVERMAAGDLSERLLPTTRDEVGQLTRAFNYMAEQLQDKVTTLDIERSRLSTVLEHMVDGVIITDESGVITMANAAAARILRYDLDNIVGCRFAQVAYSHHLMELWNRCYESGQEQNETIETALYGNFLQAIMTPLQSSMSPRILVMLQDLTHVRRLETVRRDFISNISHELRTPLASLSLVVETLRDGAIEDPPVARRFLSHMEGELASLTQMVEELLELSRIESGRVPLNIKPTRVRKLIYKPIKSLQPQAERKGIELVISVPEDLPRVYADAKRIHQVVINLVHNAIKFTSGGGTVTVFARLGDGESAGSEIVIGVADTGVGIPEEDLARIFERFYKTDRARAQEGTGLGLAIAKHIVQGHRGRIWVESIEGVGSTFYFALPTVEQAESQP